MRITVRLGEPLRRAVGPWRLVLEFPSQGTTVAGVLAHLASRYPDFAAAYQGTALGHSYPYQLFVNAQLVPAGEENEWLLRDGDKVYIFLPAVGGDDTKALPASFYARPTLIVARDLLGQLLVREWNGQRMSGRIVEVEAYIGESDQASHAARGRTARNRAMYGRPGVAYVYLIYGVHHCLNVVTEGEGFPAAVLIRALDPVEGADLMAKRRSLAGGALDRALANGPGKLCHALAIDRDLDGHDVTVGTKLWIEPGPPVADRQVEATPRVNVRGDNQARTVPWRLVVRRQP